MKRWYVLAGVGVIVLAAILFQLTKEKVAGEVSSVAERRSLELLVYTTGQLEAEKSEKINVPVELSDRRIRIYELKITDLVEEGTMVDSADYVGMLDHSVVEEALKKAREEYEQIQNEFIDAQMDSNMNLSNIRDQITTAKEDVEEKKIVLEESVYEAPSVKRKAEMDYEKSQRKLEQEEKGYVLKKQQAESKLKRKGLDVEEKRIQVDKLDKLRKALTIYAPKPGMVIYAKTPWGEKTQVGTAVSRWRSVIAELPDLTTLVSKTYVNEIDISNVKVGQKVTIGIDAFPEKRLSGEVIAVANVGQPLPNSDAKVFEVKVRVHGSDPDLKPAMTTGNVINAGVFEDVLVIPSDAVFENDSLQYVFLKKEGLKKQVVELGRENENFVEVLNGVSEGDNVLLTVPVNAEELVFSGMDIYEQLKEKEEQKREDEISKRKGQEKITAHLKNAKSVTIKN